VLSRRWCGVVGAVVMGAVSDAMGGAVGGAVGLLSCWGCCYRVDMPSPSSANKDPARVRESEVNAAQTQMSDMLPSPPPMSFLLTVPTYTFTTRKDGGTELSPNMIHVYSSIISSIS